MTRTATGLTDEEFSALADDLYENRESLPGDEVGAEIDPNIRSVVSVRFNRSEIALIEAAARSAGLALSTYIRNTALSAAGAVDLDAARRDIASLASRLEQLRRHLGDAA